MNFDFDTSNYSKEDYYEIFNLDKSLSITESLLNEKHKTLLNNIKNENMDVEQKKEIATFLTECKKNLLEIIKKDNNYKLIDSDFIPDMNQSVTFNNSHQVIKKDGSDESKVEVPEEEGFASTVDENDVIHILYCSALLVEERTGDQHVILNHYDLLRPTKPEGADCGREHTGTY